MHSLLKFLKVSLHCALGFSASIGNIVPYLAAVTPWCQVVQVPYPESGKRLSRESGKSRDQMSDIKFNYFSTNSNQARLEGSEIERERLRERARDTERESADVGH